MPAVNDLESAEWWVEEWRNKMKQVHNNSKYQGEGGKQGVSDLHVNQQARIIDSHPLLW